MVEEDKNEDWKWPEIINKLFAVVVRKKWRLVVLAEKYKINSNHLSLSDDTTLLDEISVSTRERLTFSWITVEIGNIVKNIVFSVFNLIREIRCRYQPALIESIDCCGCREATLKRELISSHVFMLVSFARRARIMSIRSISSSQHYIWSLKMLRRDYKSERRMDTKPFMTFRCGDSDRPDKSPAQHTSDWLHSITVLELS